MSNSHIPSSKRKRNDGRNDTMVAEAVKRSHIHDPRHMMYNATLRVAGEDGMFRLSTKARRALGYDATQEYSL